MSHKQKHQWILAVLSMAAVAAGTITLLRQKLGTSLKISIPGEVQLPLFLVAGILPIIYVYRETSRAIEREIRLPAARQTLWFIKNGVMARPSEDESELASELRVTNRMRSIRYEGHRAIGRATRSSGAN